MHYLYYINSKYNVCYKMGEGLDKKKSVHQAKCLLLKYLRNLENMDFNLMTLSFEDEIELKLNMQSIVYEEEDFCFIFGEHLEHTELDYEVLSKEIIEKSVESKDKKDIYNVLDFYNFDESNIRYPLSHEEFNLSDISDIIIQRPRAHSI